jgi:tetratricopeptide (TPR) repeat protein
LTFGNYLAYLKQFDAAKEYCQYLLHLHPDDHPKLASIYNNMALIYSAMNDDQEALRYLEKAASSNVPSPSMDIDQRIAPTVDSPPDHIELLNKMAEMSCCLGDRTKALDFYRQALEITMDINSQKFYEEKIQGLLFFDDSY